MLANYDKILCDDVIHTYNDDFLYTMLMISNGYWVLPSKKISAHKGYAKRNMVQRGSVYPMGKTHQYLANKCAFPKIE
jgi:hypothetical protein